MLLISMLQTHSNARRNLQINHWNRGFIATIEHGDINDLLGIAVGLATLAYMTGSAIKIIRELRNEKD